MDLTDVLMIIAVLLSPLFAVQVTQFLNRRKEANDKRLEIFKTLMSTRGYRVSLGHVFALNTIEFTFDRKVSKDEDVVIAWKAYRDSLNSGHLGKDHYSEKHEEIYVKLLYKMSIALNYDFDEITLKHSHYTPIIHKSIDDQWALIRENALEVLQKTKILLISGK